MMAANITLRQLKVLVTIVKLENGWYSQNNCQMSFMTLSSLFLIVSTLAVEDTSRVWQNTSKSEN